MSQKRAILYCRVSTDKQVEEGTSLETQEEALRVRAGNEGWAVAAVYREEGRSGADYEARTELQKALRDIEEDRGDILLVYSVSRLSRDTEHASVISRRIRNAGGRLVIQQLPMQDDPMGRLMLNQFTGFEQFRREVILEETSRGRKKMAKKGLQPCRSRPPYGYKIATKTDVLTGKADAAALGKYEPCAEQARVVQEIFSRYAGGGSLMGLANWLTLQAVPTPKGGGLWRPRTILYILTNPVYKGTAEFGKSIVLKDERRRTERGLKHSGYQRPREGGALVEIEAPALVDEETWGKCQVRMSENKSAKGGNPNRRYLLSGFLRCPECGRAMAGRGYAGRRYYSCNRTEIGSHPRKCYPVDSVESALTQGLVMGLSAPESIAAAIEAYKLLQAEQRTAPLVDVEALRIQLADVDKQEEAAARAQVDAMKKGRNTAVYETLLDEVKERRETILARLHEVEDHDRDHQFSPDAPMDAARAIEALYEVLNATDTLTIDERREAVRGFVKEIIPNEEGLAIRLHPFCQSGDTVQLGVVM
jgi:site-specific DNA recombinase